MTGFSKYFLCYQNEMFRIKVTVRGISKLCAFLGRYEVPCYWQNCTTHLSQLQTFAVTRCVSCKVRFIKIWSW
jgi:hypothetical protein